jgi:hypothetical protein
MAMLLAAIHHPAAPANPVHAVVVSGDSLSKIAASDCGTAQDWTGIYTHNKEVIGGNPNLILPGQNLKVVCKSMPVATAAPAPAPTTSTTTAHSDPWDGKTGACGDGDEDGYDMPCSALNGGAAQAAPTAPAAAPVQAAAVTGYTAGGSFQQCVISRESGGNAQAVNASSGAGGLYQFLPSTWQGLGFSGLPENAPVSVQNAAFAKEYAQSGTSAWSAYDGC